MKIVTKEEERENYNETLKGGSIGGVVGLAASLGVVALGSTRYPVIRHLTLPMKAFLVTSGGTFAAIVTADRYSRAFEAQRNPQNKYREENARLQDQLKEQQSAGDRAKGWVRENRYQLVGGSWVASIAAAFALVGRNPYLTGPQKIVQARVYAQGFTVLVMAALAAFELGDKNKGTGRWETVKVLDPEDPEHKRIIEKKIHHESYEGEDLWRDMVEAEERKIKERKQMAHEYEKEHHVRDKKGNGRSKSGGKSSKQEGDEGDKGDKGDKGSKQEEGKDGDGDESKESKKGPTTGGKPRPANLP